MIPATTRDMSDTDHPSEPAENPDPEIVVTGYSPRYTAAVRHVLAVEGGFVDDPADRGGATKYGISLRFLASETKLEFDHDLDGDLDGADIRALTRQDAVALYHRCFWQRIEADLFPMPVGEMLFDQAVNGGLGAARKLLQRTINTCLMQVGQSGLKLAVDGAVGPATRAALARVLYHPAIGPEKFADTFRDAVRERYRAIAANNPSQKRFLKGWLARADRLGRGLGDAA